MMPEQRNLDAEYLISKFINIRAVTVDICKPLNVEDHMLQCMPDVSPPKWHLAHTSWFFEEFVLKPFQKDYKVFDEKFSFLFNSYYETIGARHPRPERGQLSRPTIEQVYEYRRHVDQNLATLIAQAPSEAMRRVEIGLQHEQQHQELLLSDIKYNFFCSPLKPTYDSELSENITGSANRTWLSYEQGVAVIGACEQEFSFDHERPRHNIYVQPFAMASHLITNGEFMEFIDSGGYQRPEFWLAEGIDIINQQGWRHPMYWHKQDGQWYEFGLNGQQLLQADDVLTSISYYEADAYARFRGCRLPYETEWEIVAASQKTQDNFVIKKNKEQKSAEPLGDIFGVGWQWTCSAFGPYPGYQAEKGALGEYNGKFMCNQYVLRGGSVLTPPNHIRCSYRNFFTPVARWQKTAIRLVKEQ
jgi:ergothioneine biosynthesis protein EgtB